MPLRDSWIRLLGNRNRRRFRFPDKIRSADLPDRNLALAFTAPQSAFAFDFQCAPAQRHMIRVTHGTSPRTLPIHSSLCNIMFLFVEHFSELRQIIVNAPSGERSMRSSKRINALRVDAVANPAFLSGTGGSYGRFRLVPAATVAQSF